jgi:hypothetical protein
METAQQETTEQQQKETLRELKNEISRRDKEIANIECELRVVLEVLRRQKLSPPCHIPAL